MDQETLIRSGRKIREGRGMNVTSMSYASIKLPKVSLKSTPDFSDEVSGSANTLYLPQAGTLSKAVL